MGICSSKSSVEIKANIKTQPNDTQNTLQVDKQIPKNEIATRLKTVHNINKNANSENVQQPSGFQPNNNKNHQFKNQKIEPEEEEEEEEKYENNQDMNNEHLQRQQKKKNKKIIAQENQELYEKIKKIQKEVTEQDIIEIVHSLKKNFLFYDLGENEFVMIIKQMFYCQADKGSFIFKQGDNASSFFIIESGKVEIIINDQVKKVLQKGQEFGELALLYNSPRSASVRVLEDCKLWGIDRSTFKKISQEISQKQFEENFNFMQKVEFFRNLRSDQQQAILSVVSSQKFENGQVIVKQGDEAQSFFVIKHGNVSVIKDKKEIRQLGQGEYFGELALFYKTVRSCTVQALSDVICLAIGSEDVLSIFQGIHLQQITYKNKIKWAIEKDDLLQKLTKIQVEKILDKIEISNKSDKEVIFEGGVCPQNIVIPIDCQLKYQDSNGKLISVLGANQQQYGLQYFTNPKTDAISKPIILEGDGVIAILSFNSLKKIIGDNWKVAMEKNEKSHEKFLRKSVARPTKKINQLKIQDLVKIKKLGSGSFGHVYLVSHGAQLYALKCISKAQILEEQLEKHLLQEKLVQQEIEFPFIMNFIQSFKDDYNIYFLSEFIKGIELFDAMMEIGLLTIDEARFYIAQVIFAIEYLHGKSIIYRDLKPENIMVEVSGYIKLIDMGTAKILKNSVSGRTFTMLGTPHYLAPEVLTSKGYTYSVDLWSIGIMLYELIVGYFPFGNDVDDPYEIYEDIIKKELQFPSFVKDPKCKQFIQQLLSKLPEVRLGGSYAALKAHKFFNKFEWDQCYHKEVKPRYVPSKNKIISDDEITKGKMEKQLIIEVIQKDPQIKKMGKKRLKPADPNWDKHF